jgi:N-acetylglutamate synthase-like GNAT family acetyltransferase
MIRKATRYDIPRLLEIVEAYSRENPIKILGHPKNFDAKHLENLLFGIIMGRGFAYIDNHMRGAIIGIKTQNVWSPKVRELNELLWWVEPEYRNGTVGGRLWKAFDKEANEMLARGEIHFSITSVSAAGPLIDYTKRGYKPVGASFVKE